METTLKGILKDRYKVNLTDEEYGNMEYIMGKYNFTPVNCSFDAHNNYETFINNAHLIKDLRLTRTDTKITMEEIIYILHPAPFGESMKLDFSVPKIVKKEINRQSRNIEPDFDYNIAIIRSIYISSNMDGCDVDERFTFMIYSKDLVIHSGIIFETIDDKNITKG